MDPLLFFNVGKRKGKLFRNLNPVTLGCCKLFSPMRLAHLGLVFTSKSRWWHFPSQELLKRAKWVIKTLNSSICHLKGQHMLCFALLSISWRVSRTGSCFPEPGNIRCIPTAGTTRVKGGFKQTEPGEVDFKSLVVCQDSGGGTCRSFVPSTVTAGDKGCPQGL